LTESRAVIDDTHLMTLPVKRRPSVRLERLHMHAVALVKDGANLRPFALVRKELPMPDVEAAAPVTMTMTADVKRVTLAALGSLAEQAVAMADVVAQIAESTDGPSELPSALGTSVVEMTNSFVATIQKLLPPPAVEVPVVEAEVQAAAPAADAPPFPPVPEEKQLEMAGGVVEKAIEIAKAANIVPSEKGLGAVAKAMGPKLHAKQFMGLYNEGFQQFFALLIKLLPFLQAIDEASEAMTPGGAPLAEEAEAPANAGLAFDEMSAAVAKSVDGIFSTRVASLFTDIKTFLSPLEARLGGVEAELAAVAKARGGSQGLTEDEALRPTKKRATSYTEDISERLRNEGKL
jgi:hypothetical protein